MKRFIRTYELNRLRVLANMVEQSRNFYAFNQVIIRPRGVE